MSWSTPVVPGVYWDPAAEAAEELPWSGVAGFIGEVHPDADPTPALIESWSHLRQRYGDGPGYLSPALRGYFDNGGRSCRVLPLVRTKAGAFDLDALLRTLRADDDLSLLVAPGLVDVELQAALIAHALEMEDRFVLLDAPQLANARRDAAVEQLRAHAASVQGLTEAGRAALYAPWIMVDGWPGGPSGASFVPPSGHVVGVVGLIDQDQGVHVAPANQELEGVYDLLHVFDDAQLAALYPAPTLDAGGRLEQASINPIRALPGRGVRVWGARTLSTDPAWSHVPVRRLMIDLQRWATRKMEQFVFEPNDVTLRIRLLRALEQHLIERYSAGALVGQTQPDAYSLKCDAENNPPELAEAGLLVVDVGVAPAVPREFLVLRLVHQAAGVTAP